MTKLDFHEAQEQLAFAASALVALGRAEDALHEIEAGFGRTGADRPELAELYARVARASGKPAARLLEQLGDDFPESGLVWLKVKAGLPVTEDQIPSLARQHLSQTAAIMLAARSDADRALRLAAEADAGALSSLEEEAWALLLAESLRRAPDDQLTQALQAAASLRGETAAAIRAFVVDGRREIAFEDSAFEVRAAAELARSRKKSLPAGERSALLARARRDDLLHGIVTSAADAWKNDR